MSFNRFISLYKPYVVLLFVLLVVYILGILETNEQMKEIGSIILVPATFLYGIFAGFYISIAVGENSHMRETTLAEVGSLDVIVSTLGIVDKNIQKEFIKAVDEYVQKVLEYEAIDAMIKSEDQYNELKNVLAKVDITKYEIPTVSKKIFDTFDQFYDARQRRYMISGNVINGVAWGILASLSIMIIAGFLLQSPGNLVYDLLIILATTAIAMVLITIYEIDNFIYRENHDVFMQYRVLYKDIGLSPYYPYESVKYKRAIPEAEESRIGFFVDGKRKVLDYKPMSNEELLKLIEIDFKKLSASTH